VRAFLLWAAAFVAGFLGWRVASPAAPAPRAQVLAVPPPAAEAPAVPEVSAAEARSIRRRLDLLATVPLRELVLYGKEPLADRLRRARGLEESERRQTLREWAQRAVYDRAKAQEMLALVREEQDPEILSWLGEMIDMACLLKMNEDPTFSEDEKRAMVPLALSGEPLERRIAALRVIGGDRQNGLPADVQQLLSDVLRRDPEPAVVAAAAEEITQRYGPDTLPALLEAYRRLPPGDEQRKVAQAYAQWAEWPQASERIAEARGPEEHDLWVGAWASRGRHDPPDEDLVSLYRETSARDVRRDVFFRLANRVPPRLDLMKQVAALEGDADLRARYERILSSSGPKVDLYSALYK
jgi:hypothetical protein